LYVTLGRLFIGGTSLFPRLDYSERIAAIIDFAFNLGIGALRISTLLRRLNAEQWDAACTEIKRWNKASGRVLPGLPYRRQAEAILVG
jgi:lysozyme